ncbi:MAG: WD40 repeat domain-containing protein [Planctomycetota bacterium]
MDRIHCGAAVPGMSAISGEWLPFTPGGRHPLREAGLLPPADADDGMPWQIGPFRQFGPWHLHSMVGCYAWRHASRVTSIATSPDGRVALTGSTDYTARLWDLNTGREIRTFTAHSGLVTTVAIHDDGLHCLTGSRDETVIIQELATGRTVRVLEGHSGAVIHACWMPDREHVLTTADDGSVRIWDASGEPVGELISDVYNPVIAVSFSPDGKLALTGTTDGSIALWNLESYRAMRRYVGEQTATGAIAFSRDNRFWITGLRDGRLLMRELSNGREVLCVADGSGGISALGVSPDGTAMASGTTAGDIRLRRLPDGDHMLACNAGGSVTALSFTPDGRHLLAGRADGTIWLLSTDDGSPCGPRHSLGAAPVAYAARSNLSVVLAPATTTPPLQPRLWVMRCDGTVRDVPAPVDDPHSVAMSADGSTLLIGGDRTARVWNLESDSPGPLLPGHNEEVTAVALSPDGKSAITAGADGHVQIWTVASDPPRLRLRIDAHSDEVTAIAFAGPSLVVSAGMDSTVRVHDATSGRELSCRRGHDGGATLAISPDGRYALSGGRDGVALLWDIPAMIRGDNWAGAWLHDRRVLAVQFSPDGTMFHTLAAGAWRSFRFSPHDMPVGPLPPGDDPLGPTPVFASIHDDILGGALSADGQRMLVVTARNVVLDYLRQPEA